jgi:hypothetical protein
MELDQLLQLVKPQWHKDFLRFIDTGEASANFLAYLNQDEYGQKAVEMAFDAQASAFEGLAKELAAEKVESRAPTASVAQVAPADIARIVRNVMGLDPSERYQVLQEAASSIEASISPKQKDELKNVGQEIERAFSASSR